MLYEHDVDKLLNLLIYGLTYINVNSICLFQVVLGSFADSTVLAILLPSAQC